MEVCDNATVRLDEDNEPQPDALLRRIGGPCAVDDDGYLRGAPDLVVEVASSSAAYDLHQKMDVYRRHGVRTYVVHVVREGLLRWFELERGRYVERTAGEDGILRSRDLPGLWLDARAYLAGDLLRVVEILQVGLAQR